MTDNTSTRRSKMAQNRDNSPMEVVFSSADSSASLESDQEQRGQRSVVLDMGEAELRMRKTMMKQQQQ